LYPEREKKSPLVLSVRETRGDSPLKGFFGEI
jgi:hypothetical protein